MMKQQDHSQDYSAIIADDGRQSLHPLVAVFIAVALVSHSGSKEETKATPPKPVVTSGTAAVPVNAVSTPVLARK